MGFGLLMRICVLLLLGGSVSTEEPGTDFAVVFMQNFLPDVDYLSLEVLLTAFFPDTQATIQLLNKGDRKHARLTPGLPLTVHLPKEMEILYSTRSNHTVRITSNKPISVVATNSKPYKTSVTVLSPVVDWGMEYYVVTPDIGPEESLRQMAIVNGPHPNFVSILLRGPVEFENSLYLAGEHLNLTLNPWEAVQLQASRSLTGSHVLSQKPLALFAGRTCAEMRGRCQVCLQLPPVSDWGFQFLSPPLPFEKVSSKIYLLAATETEVNLLHGLEVTNLMVTPGVVKELDFDPTMKLFISSEEKILVLLHFGGGLQEPSEGFLFNLAPREKACFSYSIVSVPKFHNVPLVIAQADARGGLQLNREHLLSNWTNVHDTNLFYTLLPVNGRDYHFIHNPGHSFGVVTIGMAKMNAYGALGVCLDKVYHLCGFECPDGQLCPKSACMAPETQTCMAWRTHLRTLQGTYHHQSGNCQSVLLASPRVDRRFGSFHLERRPDYKFVIQLEAFEKRLEIPAASPGTVLVNGELKYAPIILEDGNLNITRFGLYIFVKTSFGLQIIVADHNGFVHIQIPSVYSGVLSGLCLNQLSTEWSTSEDLNNHSKEGSTSNNHEPLSSERIWPTQNANPDCNSSSLVKPKRCENKDQSALLLKCLQMEKSEVFQACHSTLDPKPFVESCEFEACETGNVCLGLGAYALACGIEGVNLTGWRSFNGCDLQCPPYSHYESCPLSFPKTCLTTPSPDHHTKSCFETCACDEDFQLSLPGTCVHPNACGCHFEGNYYTPGEEFHFKNCSTKCHCNGTNVECYETQGCDPGHECELSNGKLTCRPQQFVSCFLRGNDQYVRFDGHILTRNGSCQSTVVKVCSKDLGLEYFSVHTVPERDAPHLAAVHIGVHGKMITLFPQLGQVSVDGVFVQTPYTVKDGLLIAAVPSWRITLYSNFGLLVTSEINGNLLIKIPAAYLKGVCGLCSPADNSSSSEPPCSVGCQGICPSCHLKEYIHYLSRDLCGTLTDPYGPFRECLGYVKPESYVEECLNDLCSNKTLCYSLSSYVAACQEAGVHIRQWRSSTLCDYGCPPNSHYSMCASGCPATCGVNFPLLCPPSCREGCVCNPGYVWGDGGCVLPEECGCYLTGGRYLKEGDVFYEDCQVACTCMRGEVVCANHTCSANERCQTVGDVKACYPKPITCWVSGQKYHTFDGASFSAHGDCMYTMVTTKCTANSTAELDIAFQQGGNVPSGNLSTTQSTRLRIHGHTIVIQERSDSIEVDGISYPLPFYLETVLTISGRNTGNYAYVQIKADHGLLLMASSSMVWINLPSSYTGKICGLCGDGNGSSNDDLEGQGPEDFLSNWISSHGNLCQAGLANNSALSTYNLTAGNLGPFNLTNGGSGLVNLTVGDLGLSHLTAGEVFNQTARDMARDTGLFNLAASCDVIGAEAFSECQYVMFPNWFYHTCLDYAARGLVMMVCEVIEMYSSECQDAGATVYQWEDQTICGSPTKYAVKTQLLPGQSQFACMYDGVFQHTVPESSSTLHPSECTMVLALVHNATALNHFSVRLDYIIGPRQSGSNLVIEVYGMHILIPTFWVGHILVNRIPTSVPVSLASHQIKIWFVGSILVLGTNFGLLVMYNLGGSNEVSLLIPVVYQNKLYGWCGGAQFSSMLPTKQYLCVETEGWSCGNETLTQNGCTLLLHEDGPFEGCQEIFSPMIYYKECQRLFCASGGDQKTICEALKEYTRICQANGAIVKQWWNDSFCREFGR